MAQIESTQSAEFVLSTMSGARVDRLALFARMHRKRNGERNVLEAARLAPGKIVAGAPKSFDERDDLSAGFVEDTLAGISRERFAFVGEIMFTHGDKTHGEQTSGGERYVDPLAPGVGRLMEGLKGRRVPVMTHWEVYDWERDWPRVSRLYGEFPAQVFIWPHAGFANAEQVATVISHHPNVVATLSKKEHDQRALSDHEKASRLGPALIDECGALRPEWKALILRYPDRFLFATDAHKDFRWDRYAKVVLIWRRILGQLPAESAEKVAFGNATRVYGVQ
jgi:Amidohydrolase